MSAFNHGAFVKALRVRRGSIPADLYADLMAALESGLSPSAPVAAPVAVPNVSKVPWVSAARSMLGLREIAGPKHNPKILEMWVAAKASFIKDDENPWCAALIALVMVMCNIVPPPDAFRAISWATWGKACNPQVGAIGVKKRKGGNHVFVIVGITADGKYYLCLGGNQGNMVSIIPILVEEVNAVRWPASMPVLDIRLPVMARGTTGASEA